MKYLLILKYILYFVNMISIAKSKAGLGWDLLHYVIWAQKSDLFLSHSFFIPSTFCKERNPLEVKFHMLTH